MGFTHSVGNLGHIQAENRFNYTALTPFVTLYALQGGARDKFQFGSPWVENWWSEIYPTAGIENGLRGGGGGGGLGGQAVG